MTRFAHAMTRYDILCHRDVCFTPRIYRFYPQNLSFLPPETCTYTRTRFAHAMTRYDIFAHAMTFYDIAMSASPPESIVSTPINVYASTYKYIHATCACAHACTACACATHAHAHAQHAHACTPKTAMSRRHRRCGMTVRPCLRPAPPMHLVLM